MIYIASWVKIFLYFSTALRIKVPLSSQSFNQFLLSTNGYWYPIIYGSCIKNGCEWILTIESSAPTVKMTMFACVNGQGFQCLQSWGQCGDSENLQRLHQSRGPGASVHPRQSVGKYMDHITYTYVCICNYIYIYIYTYGIYHNIYTYTWDMSQYIYIHIITWDMSQYIYIYIYGIYHL